MKPFLSLLCSKAATFSGVSESVLINYWSNRISASLQKHIAKMIIVSSALISLPSVDCKARAQVPTSADVRRARVVYSSH